MDQDVPSVPPGPEPAPPSLRNASFGSTMWSLVLAAGNSASAEAHTALTRLCQTYWYPLFCCVRRHGYSPEDAQDLTQGFFAKLLAKNQISLADPDRGRFRTFLLHSLENFLHNEHERASAQKRGGGQPAISLDLNQAEEQNQASVPQDLSPAQLFERRWAAALLRETLGKLRREFALSSREELFDRLEPHLWGDETSTPYAQIASQLDLTVVAVKVTMHRLRQRYRDLLREEIAQTVAQPEDVEDELHHLRRVLAGGA